jgi:hypothetical protein
MIVAKYSVLVMVGVRLAAVTTAFAPRHSSALVTPQRSALVLAAAQDDAASLPGHTVYQRTLFRLSSPSEDDDDESTPPLVVEERLRYRPSASDPSRVEPIGPRTLILRDGNVEEGALGDALGRIDVHQVQPSTSTATASTLQHGGRTGVMDDAIVTSLYLAANGATFCQGKVLELAAGEGLGALMGCLGAAHGMRGGPTSASAADDDILSFPSGHKDDKDATLPEYLVSLTITDEDPVLLDVAASNLQALSLSNHKDKHNKISVQPLDWRHRPLVPRQSATGPPHHEEYATIVVSDVALTFPETKALARCLAHRLAPSNPICHTESLYAKDTPGLLVPRVVHLSRPDQEETLYLRKYLGQGCRMTVTPDYVAVEKIGFVPQSIESAKPSEEDALLDKLELEVASVRTLDYALTIAQHHPDYAGGGSGEVFFPMEASADFSVWGNAEGALEKEPDRRGPF